MSFSDLREPSSPLFKKWKILKIKDIVNTQNCVLVHSFLKGKLPKSFAISFKNVAKYTSIRQGSVALKVYS